MFSVLIRIFGVSLRGVRLSVEWVEKAEVFLREARRHFGEGIYWLTCFEAHQASELYLRALLVSLTGLHPYTHDLSELLDSLKALEIDVPRDVALVAELLTPHYTLARYPGKRVYTYNSTRASLCIESCEKIVSWVKSVADP
jgi:HEPN domain-containing protein